MPAAEIADASGIPEQVIVEKFGLRGKHIAAVDEHVSDLSVRAAERLLEETGTDPGEIDVVMPAITSGPRPEAEMLALVDAWIVGRPVDEPS